MGIPGSANLMLLGGGAQAYQIEQSLRFDGSSAYLSRTPASAGNRKTFTYSAWVKKCATANNDILSVYNSGTDFCRLYFALWNTDELALYWYNGGLAATVGSSGFYRDPSAWYHMMWVVDTTQSTASDRIKLYVNGALIDSFSTGTLNYPSQNSDLPINNSVAHNIGGLAGSGTFDGYLAEVNFIDGSALAPSDFGEYDDNGVWRPIEYTGTYSGNSFYLKFDPSATNGIGHDHSGNGNNWTASGFTTSGTGTDVMSDTPTTNWATFNPLTTRRNNAIWGGGAYADGNLTFYNTASTGRHTLSTFQVPTGKWYAEIRPIAYGSSVGSLCGLMLESLEGSPDSTDHFTLYFQSNGNLSIEGTNQTTFTTNSDVFSIAVDNTVSPVQVVVRKNDTVVGSNPYSFTADEPFSFYSRSIYGAYHSWNFGAQGFTYTPPSGYKALNSKNFPAPDIADGSEYFNTVLWTGTSAEHAITGVGFQPDWSWIKGRTNSTNHVLSDVVRGSTEVLESDSTAAAYTDAQSVKSFDTDGVTLGTSNDVNNSTSGYNSYVGWFWKAGGSGSSNTAGDITSTVSANPSAGFSIVSYTGTLSSTPGTAPTVGHGLGVAPSLIISKSRNPSGDDSGAWYVNHVYDHTRYLRLNTDAAAVTIASQNGGTAVAPTSTVFSTYYIVGSNTANNNYIAYCFAEVEGYSKFGSYTGNGSTDGPFVYCGFKPAFVMIKVTDQATTAWMIRDDKRDTNNPNSAYLMPNNNLQEYTNLDFDFLSNGFKPRHTNGVENVLSKNYIFAAFASSPFGGDGVSPATAR